jgi:hypothetical protein
MKALFIISGSETGRSGCQRSRILTGTSPSATSKSTLPVPRAERLFTILIATLTLRSRSNRTIWSAKASSPIRRFLPSSKTL